MTEGTLDEPEGAGCTLFLLTSEILERAPHGGRPVQLRDAEGGTPRLAAFVLLAIALGGECLHSCDLSLTESA